MKQRRKLPPRGSRLLGAVGAMLLVFTASWWMLAGGDRGINYAVVVTCAAALLTLYVAVFGVPWQARVLDHGSLAAAARDVARDAGEREAEQQQRLLADTGQARPANIGFRRSQIAHWRLDGGADRGSLTGIKAFYEGLGHGRLVILGKAGAGKTVLASNLLVDLIRGLPADDPPQGARLIVPVRLSLSSFNPGGDLDRAQPVEISGRLDAWVSDHLTNVHGVKNFRTASALVRNGWVLPILDGLDEMDPPNEKPHRAAAVIRALNYPTSTLPRRVVITCRADRYRQITNTKVRLGQQSALQDATAIRILPLAPGEIEDYLTYRFPNPGRPGSIQSRWQPVVRDITGPRPSVLAAVLSSPLRLFLAITAYHEPTSDPALLIRRPAELERDLLLQLIPATVSQYPKRDGTLYDSGDVTRWLTTLANYLYACQERRGGSGSDIELHELWIAAGARLRLLSAAIQSLIASLPCLAIVGWNLSDSTSRWTVIGAAAILTGGLSSAVFVFLGASFMPSKLIRADLSWLRTPSGRREFVRKVTRRGALGLMFGFVFGLGIWLQFRTLSGLAFGLACGIAFGLGFGLLRGIERRPTAINCPSQLVRQGWAHYVITVLTFGLGFGLASGITAWFWSGFVHGFVRASVGAFVLGSGIGMYWLYSSPWPRYLVATHILARDHLLPPRLSQFLDWAYAAGLLRLSGTSVQFRHREFQDDLTNNQLAGTVIPSVRSPVVCNAPLPRIEPLS